MKNRILICGVLITKPLKLWFFVVLVSLQWVYPVQGAVIDELPLVTARLTIHDEGGQPIHGVQVGAGCSSFRNDDTLRDSSVSDTDGICILKLKAFTGINVWTEKIGYYPSIAPARHERSIDERFRFDPFVQDGINPRDRGIEPPMKKEVNLEASVTLRGIKNPIPLFGKSLRMDIPARDVWLGYDFEVGDWVKPHGAGIHSDMRIRSKPKLEDPEDHFRLLPGGASLEIDFGQDGGLIRVTKDNGWLPVSEMKMPHVAPETGYEQLPVLKIEQQGWQDSSENDKAEGYFFRTRVKREGDKIVSARFGKLWGRINYIPVQRKGAWLSDKKNDLPAFGSLEFIYYFNPTANDRNLEFDLKKNLFERLDPEQWLRQP